MFEHFDDPNPPSPAPLDGVAARGRRLRNRRRAIAAGAVALVLVAGIASAAALQGGTREKVIVSNEQTTTTTDTTVPEASTTTVDGSAVVCIDGGCPEPSTTTTEPATTTTTQPPHDPHDYSMLSVDYGKGGLSLLNGETRNFVYTVHNNGPWDVEFTGGGCPVYLRTRPATYAWAPYSSGIWPQPYPAWGAGGQFPGCLGNVTRIQAKQAAILANTLVAGYRDAAGNLFPAAPGFTSFQASYLTQCVQPCAWDLPNSINVSVDSPAWPPPPSLYTITLKTLTPTAASGQSTTIEMRYTNGLDFTMREPLFGPCWTVKSGQATVDCSGKLPAVIVGPHQTVDLVGTIWARNGFKATGNPLKPGRYPVDVGDEEATQYTYDPSYVNLTVT